MPLPVFIPLALISLAAAHVVLFRGALQVEPVVNVGLAAANLFFLVNYAIRYRVELSARAQAAYFVGYGALVALVMPLLRSQAANENWLIVILLLLLYTGLWPKPFLLGYLFLLVIAQVYAAAYAKPAFLLAALLYTAMLPLGRIWRDEENRILPSFYVLGAVMLFCVMLPIAYFCTQHSPQDVLKTFREPEVKNALWLSLWTATLATTIVALFGVPLAYVLVRSEFAGKGAINALVDLPLLIPPPVAGLALLSLLGPKTPLGIAGTDIGERFFGGPIEFFGTELGILAVQVFVGFPFLVRSAMIGFMGIDAHYERVARTLGASASGAFFRITLPLALPSIFLGAILMWFRAIGEFGATWFVTQTPETAPVQIWKTFEKHGGSEAGPIAVLIVLVFLSLFAGLTLLRNRMSAPAAAEG